MSLDAGINSGKEHRKRYRDSRRFDSTCRNHGACSWCRDNRTHFDKKHRSAKGKEQHDVQKMGTAE